MAPAFGLVEAKGLLPYFVDTAIKAWGLRLYLILGADFCPIFRWQTNGVTSSRTASPGIRPPSM